MLPAARPGTRHPRTCPPSAECRETNEISRKKRTVFPPAPISLVFGCVRSRCTARSPQKPGQARTVTLAGPHPHRAQNLELHEPYLTRLNIGARSVGVVTSLRLQMIEFNLAFGRRHQKLVHMGALELTGWVMICSFHFHDRMWCSNTTQQNKQPKLKNTPGQHYSTVTAAPVTVDAAGLTCTKT